MVRRHIARTPTPILLLGLAAGLLASPSRADPEGVPAPEHVPPPALAQPLPDFGAEQVVLLERKGGRTTRRTKARSARLCGAEIVAEDVVMEVLGEAAQPPRWTLRTPTARLATHDDRAWFGPTQLVSQDGDTWRAQSGCWDGHARQLQLQGPACASRGAHAVCAESAVITFAEAGKEVDVAVLQGNVTGQVTPRSGG